MLEIRLFGDPKLSYDGAALPFRAPRRAFSLLAFLLLHEGEVQRDRLAYALWPDATEEEARSNFRRHLHLLRAALPAGVRWIRSDRRTVAWNGRARSWSDVEALAATSAEAAAGNARDLCRGALLEGFDDEWIVPLRERYRERFVELLIAAARRDRERGRLTPAIEHYTLALELDPYREDLFREMVRARVEAGDRAGAARSYEAFAARLRDELGVEPDAETVKARVDLLQAASHQPRASRLIPPSTSFHGRERDVEYLRDRLSTCRLVALVGPGGVGKTRLALETAVRVQERFEHGAYLVDVSPVRGTGVTERVAHAMGIREAPGTTARDALVAELHDRDVLIVLDNCEHVVDDAARFVESLLGATRRLRMLVTTREALRIPEEVVYRVRPLAASPAAFPAEHDALQIPAVQLFIDRAVARDQTLDLEAHAEAVRAICEHLDGLPLAIELAAVNLAGMSLGALAATIERRLDVLEGWRTSAPRHRTLQGMFDWSFQLLSEPLKRLFLDLAVFRGDVTVDAARAVSEARIGGERVQRLLAGLTERSLLTKHDAREPGRYRMLETTRAFAGEMLAASGDASALEHRHAQYFAGEAERMRVRYETVADDEWLAAAHGDADNFFAALERTLGAGGDSAAGATIAGALADYWLTIDQTSMAMRWLERATACDPGNVHAAVGLAAVYRRGYRFADAIAAAERALPLLRASDDGVTLCRALVIAGNSIVSSVAPDERRSAERGRAMVLESLAIAEARGHVLRVAEARFALAIVADYMADLRAALREFEEAGRLFRELGKMVRYEHTVLSIAFVSYLLGDFERATALAERSTGDERPFHGMQRAHAYELLATIAFDRGDLSKAHAHAVRALLLTVNLRLDALIDARIALLARIDAAAGRAERAAYGFGYVERCHETGVVLRHPRDRALDREWISAVRAALGDKFACFWEKGYRADRAEVLGEVLPRDRPGDLDS